MSNNPLPMVYPTICINGTDGPYLPVRHMIFVPLGGGRLLQRTNFHLNMDYINHCDQHSNGDFPELRHPRPRDTFVTDNVNQIGTTFISLIDDYRLAHQYYKPTFNQLRWYVFWVEDCHSPPFYLVNAEDYDEAYNFFVSYASEHLGLCITEEEFDDYIPSGSKEHYQELQLTMTKQKAFFQIYVENGGEFDDNGDPVDTEAVRGQELTIKTIEFATP